MRAARASSSNLIESSMQRENGAIPIIQSLRVHAPNEISLQTAILVETCTDPFTLRLHVLDENSD